MVGDVLLINLEKTQFKVTLFFLSFSCLFFPRLCQEGARDSLKEKKKKSVGLGHVRSKAVISLAWGVRLPARPRSRDARRVFFQGTFNSSGLFKFKSAHGRGMS